VASSDPALPRQCDSSAEVSVATALQAQTTAAQTTAAQTTDAGLAVASGGAGGDLRLVARLVAGDGQAWRAFVQRYGRLVLTRGIATARELGRPLDAAGAEDLCAEVFSRLVADDCRILRHYEGRSMLSTWLCVVTRRIAIRRLKTLRREPAQSAADGDHALCSLAGSPADEPLRQLLAGEALSRLTAALAQLGERDRKLVGLLFFEGCSYREAAGRLQMPMNSIGPTLARIQKRLRIALQELEP
jgi:RNA polymerase sigma-70 factor, ECF subfamily